MSPLARALRFAFDRGEALYQARGRRVLADLEGAGAFRIERAEVVCEIRADGREFLGSGGVFEESLLITSPCQGYVSVAVRTGGPPKGTTLSTNEYQGCGWVVAAQGPFEVDGRHESAPQPDEFLAVPFFCRAQAELRLEIIPAPGVSSRLIDRWSISDAPALAERGWRVQNLSKVGELASVFPNGAPRVGPVASHLNVAAWRLRVPEGCSGLVLRRIYDRFHGRQRARVLVDGQFAGWWYDPVEDRERRWACSDFGLEGQHLGARAEVEIAIDPVAGGPLWSVSEVEAVALVNPRPEGSPA